jgi:hypothetical protein
MNGNKWLYLLIQGPIQGTKAVKAVRIPCLKKYSILKHLTEIAIRDKRQNETGEQGGYGSNSSDSS